MVVTTPRAVASGSGPRRGVVAIGVPVTIGGRSLGGIAIGPEAALWLEAWFLMRAVIGPVISGAAVEAGSLWLTRGGSIGLLEQIGLERGRDLTLINSVNC